MAKKEKEGGEDQEEDEAEKPEDEAQLAAKKMHRKMKNVVWLSVFMLCATTVLGVLYHMDVKLVSDQIDAMKVIRNFMVEHKSLQEQLTDKEILAEVLKMIKVLQDYDMHILALEGAIDDAIKKINVGWRAFNGSIYFINGVDTDYREARYVCDRLKLPMTTIKTAAEEDFIESLVKGVSTGIWIGLQKFGGTWRWIDNEPLAKGFWKPDSPDEVDPREKDCVEVMKHCETPGKCWNDIPCSSYKYGICRMYADADWMQ